MKQKQLPANNEKRFDRKIFLSLFFTVLLMVINIVCMAGEPPCDSTCVNCNGNTVVIDQNITVDFSTDPPVFTGDPDMLPYWFYNNFGASKDSWYAIFDVGANKLLIKNGVTITTLNSGGFAPGITIKSICGLEVENGARIIVKSMNQHAGDIVVQIHGDVIVNGEIRDEVAGTIGLPGCITVGSRCGNILVGQSGLIQDLGVDPGGCGVSLIACGEAGIPCVNGSPIIGKANITVNGLVKSYAHAHAGDLTLNRPFVKVLAFNGSVTVNANTIEPLYDEFAINGGLFDIYGGLLAWVRDNVNPGKVEVQASGDITVNGHGTDPTGTVRKSFGAIAAVATASSSPGGLVDVRSLGGSIFGNNRAFDVSGRNRLSTNFAHIILNAQQNISLTRSGPNNTFNPVVDASSPGAGDKGGKNDLRAFSGGITIGMGVLVSAAVPAGSGTVQGINRLVACTGVTSSGIVNPPDLNTADNFGTCTPAAPDVLFPDCETSGAGFRQTNGDADGDVDSNPAKSSAMVFYPNPTEGKATLKFNSPGNSDYIIRIYDLAGRMVLQVISTAKEEINLVPLDLSEVPKGMYILILENSAEMEQIKICVQ